MRKTALSTVLSIILGLFGNLVIHPLPAEANPPSASTLRVLLLGDSYMSGNGARATLSILNPFRLLDTPPNARCLSGLREDLVGVDHRSCGFPPCAARGRKLGGRG
jgi:hypothetical protein